MSALDYLRDTYLPLLSSQIDAAVDQNQVPTVDLVLAYSAINSVVNGGGASVDYPERVVTIYDYVNITGNTPSSGDENLVEIDWNRDELRGVPAIFINALVVGNATPPGTNRTIKLNAYWSDLQMGNINNAPVQLEFRKTELGTITLANSASAVRYYKFGGIIIPEARYLYLSTERSAQDSGSSVSLTAWAVKVVA